MCEMVHSCGKNCKFIGKLNCQIICSKETDHDGEHLCQSLCHYCGEPCSLTETNKVGYVCRNKCILPCDIEHDKHHCEFRTCPIKCSIPDCDHGCQSEDHFHDEIYHFCGNEHQCHEICEEPGICAVSGLIEGTSINFIRHIQQSKRLECYKKIPPNSFEHEGKHIHSEDGIHACDAQCQFCEYYV